MKKIITLIFLLTLLQVFYATILNAQDWKKEYEDICSKTSDAMSLTENELKTLIERCDRLKSVIEALDDESIRKVYLKRLQMCRDLYQFCLEQKLLKK